MDPEKLNNKKMRIDKDYYKALWNIFGMLCTIFFMGLGVYTWLHILAEAPWWAVWPGVLAGCYYGALLVQAYDPPNYKPVKVAIQRNFGRNTP